MTLDQLVEKLKEALPSGIRAIVLYGSAAVGDHAGKRSDYNTLVVVDHLGLDTLKALVKPTNAWVKAGNPPPLLFTLERLTQSADVFPIELLDIKEAHRVLWGEDVIEDLDVSRVHLRHELEHELRGKLIQIRERYLLAGGKARKIAELMIDSLSSFQVLFRATLRLFQDDVPQRKADAVRELSEHIAFDVEVFEQLGRLKAGHVKPNEIDSEGLFRRYLVAIETVLDNVDALLRKREDTGGSA